MKIRRIAPGSQTTATRPRTPSAWVIGHSKLCLVQVVRGFFQKRIRKASEPNGASLGIGAGGRRRAEADIERSLTFTESPFVCEYGRAEREEQAQVMGDFEGEAYDGLVACQEKGDGRFSC